MKLLAALAALAAIAVGAPTAPKSVRLYVFDGGVLEGGDPARFSLKREEMSVADMSVASFLIVHPKGTLMWDSGALPDKEITAEGTTTRYGIVLPNGNERFVTTTRTLAAQLTEIGYAPSDINFFALSHYHATTTTRATPTCSPARRGWRGRSNATSCFLTSRTT